MLAKHTTVLLALSSDRRHALCVSPGTPSMVYVKQIGDALKTWSLPIQTTSSLIRLAAFHPNDSNVFLLGFQDGSIAAYRCHKAYAEVGLVKTIDRLTEIGSQQQLHKSHYQTDPIIEATFLPSFQHRAVSIARDGLCRLIDFAHPGKMLRAWRPKGLPLKVAVTCSAISKTMIRASSSEDRSSPADGCTIAVACDDGAVALYDCLGVLQHRVSITQQDQPVIGLEWYVGPAPEGIISQGKAFESPDDANISSAKGLHGRTALPSETLGMEKRLISPSAAIVEPVPQVTNNRRQFAIHPDEMQTLKTKSKPCFSSAQMSLEESQESLIRVSGRDAMRNPETHRLRSDQQRSTHSTSGGATGRYESKRAKQATARRSGELYPCGGAGLQPKQPGRSKGREELQLREYREALQASKPQRRLPGVDDVIDAQGVQQLVGRDPWSRLQQQRCRERRDDTAVLQAVAGHFMSEEDMHHTSRNAAASLQSAGLELHRIAIEIEAVSASLQG